MALTDTRLRNLKPPTGKTECLVADGNGLYIRIRTGQATSRTWQFRRKMAGRIAITTLGTYPELSLLEARRQAIELAMKRHALSPTLGEAADRWLREQVDGVHKRPEFARGYVDRAILPAFGDRRIRDIRPAEIAAAVRDYKQKANTSVRAVRARQGGKVAAASLLKIYKNLFKFCVITGWLEQSPAAQLTAKGVLGPLSLPPLSRVLDDDAIHLVLTTDQAPGPLLRFLLATGLRLGEAYNGHRDGQYWVVPAAASKNKREHRVWLSEVALAQLEQHPWCGRGSVQAWVTALALNWSSHDLRRTFATRLNGMGTAPHVVERMLNHTLLGVMGVYNKAQFLPERQQALEAWSQWLRELAGKRPSADVVPLRQPAAHSTRPGRDEIGRASQRSDQQHKGSAEL